MPNRAAMNVFVVITPLQLINALEARSTFDVRRGALLVITTPWTRRPLATMIDAHDWDEVHELHVDEHTGGLRSRIAHIRRGASVRRRLGRLLDRWPHVDRLFVGNLNDPFCRHLSNVTRFRETVALDDGTATIDIARRRALGAVSGRPDPAAWRSALYQKMMGLRSREPDRLVFFTSYDVVVGSRDRVVRNGFGRLRAQAKRREFEDTILFLGQPLVETGEMAVDRYGAYVKAAVDLFGDARFVYVPHWQESPDLVLRLKTRLHLQVLRPEVPIEVALMRSARLPRVLASFHCSALDNCRRMLGGSGMRIVACEIAADHLERNHEFIARVYDYLRERADDDLTVVPLHEALGSVPAKPESSAHAASAWSRVLPSFVEGTRAAHDPST
jgi:hypothetical protein